MRRACMGVLIIACIIAVASSVSADGEFTIRSHQPIHHSRWTFSQLDTDQHAPTQSVSITFVLQSENSVELEALLLRVSDPNSSQYGRHQSAEELKSLTGTSDATRKQWQEWMEENRQTYTSLTYEWDSAGANIIRVRMSVADAERWTGARLGTYIHSETGVKHIRSDLTPQSMRDSGVIPTHLTSTLAYVAGLTRFPPQVEMLTNRRSAQSAARTEQIIQAATPPTISGEATLDAKPHRVHPSLTQASVPGVHSVESTATMVGDYFGNQQVFKNVYLSTDNKLLTATIFFACDTPTFGGALWTAPSMTSGSPQCTRTGLGTLDYASTIVKLTQEDGTLGQTYQMPVSSIPWGRTASGRVGIAVALVLPSNYDAYKINIQFNYQSGSNVYSAQFDYPYSLSGLTRVHPATVNQFYGVPDGLTSSVSAGVKMKERMGIAALTISSDNRGYYDINDISSFYFANSISADNLNLINYVDASNPSDPLNPAYPDAETTLDISAASGVNQGVQLQVLHVSNSDTIFEDLLQLTLNDPSVHVLSISYGGWENTDANELTLANQLLMQLGVRGVSVFASSGDTGSFDANNENGTCSSFQPSYPASSPYLTSVGGTTLHRSTTTGCPTEVAASLEFGAIITSGGGFSGLTAQARPTWQDTAVQGWINSTTCAKPATYSYNTANRAYPDISLLAHNYDIHFQTGGKCGVAPVSVDGTSASSPALAGIISAYNVRRLARGSSTLGFLNPLLYDVWSKAPSAFNDITAGGSNCLSTGLGCCSDGFRACGGFDPVTGLGSPNFKVLGPYLDDSLTGGETVSNNYFPECANYVQVDPVTCPKDSHMPVGYVVLITLAVLGVVFLAVRLALQRYHVSKYGSSDLLGPMSNIVVGGGSSGGRSGGIAPPPPRNWGPGNRLGNDLNQPLSDHNERL